jgi:hypothetical protein
MHDRSGVARAFAKVGIGAHAEPPADDWQAPTEIPESADAEPLQDIPQVPTDPGDWDAGDHTDIPPPREWLLGNQFCRRFLSGVLAPGATGKTALRTLQYISLATGRPLTGQHVFKRSRVLILSLEDDDSELRRRLAAARIHHGIDPAELKGWLFCATPRDQAGRDQGRSKGPRAVGGDAARDHPAPADRPARAGSIREAARARGKR